MAILEIITVRSVEQALDKLERELARSLASADGLTADVKIEMFRDERIPTDLSIHLHYHQGRGDPHGSDLGLRLTAALKEHGHVSHSVWRSIAIDNGSIS